MFCPVIPQEIAQITEIAMHKGQAGIFSELRVASGMCDGVHVLVKRQQSSLFAQPFEHTSAMPPAP